ncbi:pirin [Acetobacter estunensis NRIC 0472]|uniref:Quercetin 2,3-dioxygenase C-terminal cupin domain-containing protein n=1 Tax=Acetobacter estunensis TaxID=104097 RepID=A0A967B5I6_9PROT|nr:hypothetical protein [Acetobacter estunensis]NHO53190.1 hypothetical protein [Acetobacter estunensis]GBQ24970.1 pirin [Acetobacter estunensis NRIC 0472]
MITVRRADTLGIAHDGGVTFHCHFAFADWQDTAHVHEGRLRVVNQATLMSGETCRLGPEANVDILSWVKRGGLHVQIDEFPHESLPAGDLHLASTGTGCVHLQWTADKEGAEFFQFWLMNDTEGDTPLQTVRAADPAQADGGFHILASGFPEDDPEDRTVVEDGSPAVLRARARFLQATIPAGEGAAYQTSSGRDLYLVVVSGQMRIGNEVLMPGDGAAVEDEDNLVVIAKESGVVLLMDIAAV